MIMISMSRYSKDRGVSVFNVSVIYEHTHTHTHIYIYIFFILFFIFFGGEGGVCVFFVCFFVVVFFKGNENYLSNNK